MVKVERKRKREEHTNSNKLETIYLWDKDPGRKRIVLQIGGKPYPSGGWEEITPRSDGITLFRLAPARSPKTSFIRARQGEI